MSQRSTPPPAAPLEVEPTSGVQERLMQAAFLLFADQGFETTTIDQITESAGVSRRTYFRYFATKEDAIFPDHDGIRARVTAQLLRRTDQPPLPAVCASVALVLDDYVRHREVSLLRFGLTRKITALRDREVTSVHRYQRVFARHLRENLPDSDLLTTELMAAAVVTAHNSVLREWLLGGALGDPRPQLAIALGRVQTLFDTAGTPKDSPRSAVAVFSLDTPLSAIVDAISALQREQALDEP